MHLSLLPLNNLDEFPNYFLKDSVLIIPTSGSAVKHSLQTASDALAP